MRNLRILVMASGFGSNFAGLARASQVGQIQSKVVGLICDRKAHALDFARELKIPAQVIAPKDFLTSEQWDREMADAMAAFDPELIVLAGFLRKIGKLSIQRYGKIMINTHPSLLPKFGGPGMYGSRVHEAVVSAGERESGITIHRVTEEYDEGGTLAQFRLAIRSGETAKELESKIKAHETQFLLDFIKDLENGRKTLDPV